MRADISILGQGLAGTLLAWELERAGISFTITDAGPAKAATSAAAGIINPVTGRRLVKSWRFESLLPLAKATFRDLEEALAVPLWREMRVRRLFADERERAVASDPKRRTELGSFVESIDEAGLWIRGAARVDLAALLAAARARWLAAGALREGDADLAQERQQHALVIDCRGVAGTGAEPFGFVPWAYSKGEVLELATSGLEANVILNRRFWVAPVRPDSALAGATHEPGVRDVQPTLHGRSAIETATAGLLGANPFAVTGHRAGIRVNLPDKRPVAGRHPLDSRIGLVNGLGAKGALWAPMLARQWVRHVSAGASFDPEIDLRRFPVARESLEKQSGGRGDTPADSTC